MMRMRMILERFFRDTQREAVEICINVAIGQNLRYHFWDGYQAVIYVLVWSRAHWMAMKGQNISKAWLVSVRYASKCNEAFNQKPWQDHYPYIFGVFVVVARSRTDGHQWRNLFAVRITKNASPLRASGRRSVVPYVETWQDTAAKLEPW